MNVIEKKSIAQEISLYLFAKYEPQDILKKMNQYNVNVPKGTDIKRQHITKILFEQEAHILKNIQNQENIRPTVVLTASGANPEPASHKSTKPKKIFISHSKKDMTYVQEIINVLGTIGVESDRIFCSSYEGYGNPLGTNYLEALKKELQGDVLVLFMLSHNFFESKIGLCEMGAVWILAQDQIPLYIPPFTAEDVKGVFPAAQGMYINNRTQLLLLKERMEKEFNIQKGISGVRWYQQIERSLKVIDNEIKQTLS
ncbi:toll/interleukin-1 receptor domain-containing protein [Aquimarina longa]|uniref:toll/interleukin-1 receptor domain-containing protein n=1 Tax=Aquimarina longa TaxID=1080221 RepID=UPI0007855FA0|nr:toll/interleukin-1 receptor domain-containing protein [Aquimarina longa]